MSSSVDTADTTPILTTQFSKEKPAEFCRLSGRRWLEKQIDLPWYNDAKQQVVRKSVLIALGNKLDGYSLRDLRAHLHIQLACIDSSYARTLLRHMLREGCITESDGTELHAVALRDPNAYLSSQSPQTSEERPAKIYRLSARRWLEEQVDHAE